MLLRLTRDLPPFLRSTVSLAEAQARVRRRLALREQQFIAVTQRAIFDQPTSPYRALLRHAGCEPGDLRRLVEQDGIEGALRTLAAQGVYVTNDEFKGRPAVRGSQRFAFRGSDFDNPLTPAHLVRYSSGTGGQPGRVRASLAFFDEVATTVATVFDAHGVRQPRLVCWWPWPVQHILPFARLGLETPGWFYPIRPVPARIRLASRYLWLLGRLGGHRFPIVQLCDLAAPDQLLRWLDGLPADGRPLVILTMPSAAARLSVAALAAGRSLAHVTFLAAGEAVTPARRGHIRAAGARTIVLYSSVELTALSYSCATPAAAADDVHVMLDRYAVVQRRRPAVEGGVPVDAVLCTTLSPVAPKIAFNTELGDYGRLEQRDCGCPLGELGMRTHLSDIRSFEKLTGEGVTFATANLQQVLEEVLPARFGGTSLDYQLAEAESAGGATRLVLRVSPTVGPVNEASLATALMDEIGRSDALVRHQFSLWRSAGTIVVRREAPVATEAGKVLPFHLLRPSRRSGGRP